MGSSQSKSQPDVTSTVAPNTSEPRTIASNSSSSSSANDTAPDNNAAAATTSVSLASENRAKKQQQQDKKEQELTGFDLVNYKCRRKEKAYKKCVSDFYSNTFLGAQSMDQEAACGEIFERYRRCYMKGVQKVVWGQDAPPPTKDSMLARFVEEEQDERDETNASAAESSSK